MAVHRDQGKDGCEHRAPCHGIDRGPVEPVPGHPGELESPYDQHEHIDQQAVQPVLSGFSGFRIDDVARNPSPRENELRQQEHGEDRKRGEESRNRFRPRKLEKVADAKQLDHDRIPPSLVRSVI